MIKISKSIGVSLLLTAFAVSGCSKDSEGSTGKSVSDVNNNVVAQFNPDYLDDGIVKIGVVSDIEGDVGGSVRVAERLGNEGIDALVIAGDCYENERIRRRPMYPKSKDNLSEMVRGIEPFARLGVPVFVIPGNHETKSIYRDAINMLKKDYPKVFDINGKSVDLEGVNIVGMGGYHHPGFTDPNGFLLGSGDYVNAQSSLSEFQSQGEPTIFVTHGPPKSGTKIDYVKGAGHVGDERTAGIMNLDLEDVDNLHGHVHEGSGGNDNYRAGQSFNIASVCKFNNSSAPNYGVVTIKDGDVKVRHEKVDR